MKEDTDVNEVGKVIAYLRSIVEQPNAGRRFFSYLKILVTNGRQIGAIRLSRFLHIWDAPFEIRGIYKF